jgi:hypothetical protein
MLVDLISREPSACFSNTLPLWIGATVAILLSSLLFLMAAPASAQVFDQSAADSAASTEPFEGATTTSNLFTRFGAGLAGVHYGTSTSTADVNNDGNLDLLIVGSEGSYNPSAALYLGDGSGNFTEAGASLTGVVNGSTSIADVNNDGNPDLLITGRPSNEAMTTLYLGDGNGGFSEANADLTGVLTSATSIADVNSDGNPDLLVTGYNSDEPGNVVATLYLGDGNGGFSEANADLTGVQRGTSTSIADVDNDGNLDLLITGSDAIFNETATLYLGDGSGDFTEADAGLTGVNSSSTSIADVNNDGNLDLLIAGSARNIIGESTKLYLGDGDGGFTEAEAELTGVRRSATSIADVDSDGNLDLLITGEDGSYPKAKLYLGDGNGGFTEAGTGLTGVDDASASIVDVDNDGNPDLLITGSDDRAVGTATLYENLTAADFRVGSSVQAVSSDGRVDFDGTDVAVAFSGTGGTGDVIVQRFSNSPHLPFGIDKANVGNDRFVISAAGTLTLDDNTKVRLDVGTLTGVGDASNVTVYKRSVRGSGIFRPVPTTYDAQTSDLVARIGTFGEFTLGSDTEPLPVEFASFEARIDEEAAELTWTTTSETNNAGFVVEHRTDSTAAWKALGFVESKADGGTTNEINRYQFETEGLDVGTHRFRLKQVDTDGSASYSRTVEASMRMKEAYRLSTYPNPVRQQATIRIATREKQSVTLRLYDALGRQVATLYDGTLQAQETKTISLQVSTLGLASGAYFLRLQAGGESETERLTVVK